MWAWWTRFWTAPADNPWQAEVVIAGPVTPPPIAVPAVRPKPTARAPREFTSAMRQYREDQ